MPELLSGITAASVESPNWRDWRIFFSDERYVPLDHPDSNYFAFNTHVLSALSADNQPVVYKIDLSGDLDSAAQLYENILREELGESAQLDMVLLGLGPDGHTASLFPNHPLLQYDGDRIIMPISDSPKPPPHRITLTLGMINKAKRVTFVATGDAKKDVLRYIFDGYRNIDLPKLYPSMLVLPVNASLTWIIDTPAAASLEKYTREL